MVSIIITGSILARDMFDIALQIESEHTFDLMDFQNFLSSLLGSGIRKTMRSIIGIAITIVMYIGS